MHAGNVSRRIHHGATPGRPETVTGSHYRGHAHFWERALSRRQFLRGAAGTTAVAAGSGLWFPAVARAARPVAAAPRPIPGGLSIGDQVFHVDFPYFGNETSTITDFNGFLAAAEMQGAGTATDTGTGATSRLVFDADMRFMQGVYVGVDGRRYRGTFGFV